MVLWQVADARHRLRDLCDLRSDIMRIGTVIVPPRRVEKTFRESQYSRQTEGQDIES
jgi:hypothetical protein